MKLSDTQRMLLVTASGRESGQLFPLKGKLAARRRDEALRGLLEMELVKSVPAPADAHVWREEGGAKLGLVMTSLARDLLAAEEDGVNLADLPVPGDTDQDKPALSGSKIGQVIALLKREGGASLEDIGRTTGWLPHSVRAALTGLRKKGHAIERSRRDDVTVYQLKREG